LFQKVTRNLDLLLGRHQLGWLFRLPFSSAVRNRKTRTANNDKMAKQAAMPSAVSKRRSSSLQPFFWML